MKYLLSERGKLNTALGVRAPSLEEAFMVIDNSIVVQKNNSII